jgi:hypothetical protein
MEIYAYERPKGITALKQEEIKVDNDAVKKRLAWAIQKALPYCNPEEEVACRKAATTEAS